MPKYIKGFTRIKALLLGLLVSSASSLSSDSNDADHTLSLGFSTYQSSASHSGTADFNLDEKLTYQLNHSYNFNSIFSIRTQWLESTSSEFSSSSDSPYSNFDFYSLAVLAQAKVNLVERVFAHGFVGINSHKTSYDGYRIVEGDIILPTRQSRKGNSLSYGVGLTYQFDHIELSLEQQWLELEQFDLDLTSFSIGYRF